MNKKIKIIELLKQMEIKENLPKQIKYKNKVFDLSCSDDGIYYYANENWSMISWIDNFYQLYEYVEILEDEDEILEDEEEIDINDIEELVGNVSVRMNNKTVDAEDLFYTISNIVLSLENSKEKTNQLIKAVKQLEKNK